MSGWDFIAKIVMIGDSGCGKSSLTIRLTDDRFSDVHDVTIAAEIGSRVVTVASDGPDSQVQRIKLQIWDTAGQEHFRSVTRSYFRNAAGCILVYDITRKQTLDHARDWLRDVRMHADDNVCVCLVGNKADLESQRQVSTAEARQWAMDHGVQHFVETSAKTGQKVVEAYEDVARQIHQGILEGYSRGVRASQRSGLVNMREPETKGRCC